jgi:protein TonB
MKKLILFSFFSFLFFVSFSQTEGDGKNMKVEMNQEAHYPQGDKALYDYLFKKVKYSEEAKTNKVSGEVMVSFWVEADSSLTKINIISDPGCGCGESLKELLSKLKFAPALVNGVPMRSKVILNVPVRAH